ncbi:MAG: hypothetical protein J6A98_03870 [Clostridia bacterium]|nr:hypothetical protein [Clostridia bacterium]
MKERLKSYKFWVALSGAVVIFVKALGQAFGFEISADVVDGVIMGFCGILVAMGLVEKPAKTTAENDDPDTCGKDEIQEKTKVEKTQTQSQNKE